MVVVLLAAGRGRDKDMSGEGDKDIDRDELVEEPLVSGKILLLGLALFGIFLLHTEGRVFAWKILIHILFLLVSLRPMFLVLKFALLPIVLVH